MAIIVMLTFGSIMVVILSLFIVYLVRKNCKRVNANEQKPNEEIEIDQ